MTGFACLAPRATQVQGRAARRGHPCAIISTLRDHLAIFVKGGPGALVFPGVKGSRSGGGNFNKMLAWPRAVASIGMTGFHFHDLRHTRNQFAAQSGAALRDLMARMDHDSERAAMIYQHVARAPTSSSRTRSTPTSRASSARQTMTRTDQLGSWSLRANGTPMARKINNGSWRVGGQTPIPAVTWVLALGAGDGNRTRTISLGICAVRACRTA